MSRKLSPAVLRAREKPSIGGVFATRVECAEPERCGKSLSGRRFLSEGWELGAFSLKTFSKQKTMTYSDGLSPELVVATGWRSVSPTRIGLVRPQFGRSDR